MEGRQRLKDIVAIVTDSGRGIGRYIAHVPMLQSCSETYDKKGHGNIVNISSGAGRGGGSLVCSVSYSVSKFGVEGMTYALAV